MNTKSLIEAKNIAYKINENKLSAEQKKFADPIFKAAAKKGGFKIKRYYMSRQPQAEIEVNKYGKVRRARIFYFRELTGKKARIKERRRS